MEAILTLVGLLGLGALLISLYVFAVAARKFVSDDERSRDRHATAARSIQDGWIPRNRDDRRQNRTRVQFPLRVNGQLILHDRRKGERRAT